MAAENVLPALTPLPRELADRVALDTLTGVLYVDDKAAGHPLLSSWMRRNQMDGHTLTKQVVEHDELANLRMNGMRQSANDEDIDQKVRQSAIELLCRAARYSASDMHIVIREGHTEIQIEVKGELRVLERNTKENGELIVRSIYQGIAGVRDASFSQYEFQNAQIAGSDLPQEAGLTSVRIARGPCYPEAQGGQFMTLRLQSSTAKLKGQGGTLPPLELPRRPEGEFRVESMGLSKLQVEKLRLLMDAPAGVVIVTGPTGSGKTTLMYECMQEIARAKPDRRQVTIEDPVEYPMVWAVQLAVTDANTEADTGRAFGERLRVGLRMAPKTILLGEMRGPDVAAAALNAALTGHQVWTTLHVSDPFMFVDRLELMDQQRLNRKVFCDDKLIRGFVGVRLLPKLCAHCSIPLAKAPHVLAPRVVSALQTWGSIEGVRLQGNGCSVCDGDGIECRFSVAEVVVTDQQMMTDMIERGTAAARSSYRARPDAEPSMLHSSIMRVLQGEVDPRRVEQNVELIVDRSKA